MSISPNLTLYIALAFYAIGTLAALASLLGRRTFFQNAGLAAMIAGFVSHTFWIGTICTITHHPPITNLPEVASFTAWTVFAVELALLIRYRVQAAAFFVYPLVLMLLTIAAVVREPFAIGGAWSQQRLLTFHILLATIGAAGLMTGVAFSYLAYLQDRSLKLKSRGRLWDAIPSLTVCKMVSYRALAIGFSVYTVGIITGIVWSYRTSAVAMRMHTKELGAVVAWVLFAVLLQSYISGIFRGRRTMLVSAAALAAIVVAILGIRHG